MHGQCNQPSAAFLDRFDHPLTSLTSRRLPCALWARGDRIMQGATEETSRAHPYIGLFKDGGVRTLWAGQALSDAGSELYRLGAIWLAVGIAGADAAWLPVAQSAAMLAFALGAGAVVDGLSARKVMIAADLIRAAVTAAVVAAA